MKTLLVLRHAKSSWKDPAVPDHERPLNQRGLAAAPRMGRLLVDEDLVPDLVLSSTARRAHETARLVAQAARYEGEIRLLPELYHATPDTYLAAAAQAGADAERVLVIGHNPGMELLVRYVGGHPETFPTAALAVLDLDIDDWADAAGAEGHLVRLWRPRELDGDGD